jgi:hypothetical protein
MRTRHEVAPASGGTAHKRAGTHKADATHTVEKWSD